MRAAQLDHPLMDASGQTWLLRLAVGADWILFRDDREVARLNWDTALRVVRRELDPERGADAATIELMGLVDEVPNDLMSVIREAIRRWLPHTERQ